MSGRGVRSRQP